MEQPFENLSLIELRRRKNYVENSFKSNQSSARNNVVGATVSLCAVVLGSALAYNTNKPLAKDIELVVAAMGAISFPLYIIEYAKSKKRQVEYQSNATELQDYIVLREKVAEQIEKQ